MTGQSLLSDLHVSYIQKLDKKRNLMYYYTEHRRLPGTYWGITSLALLGRTDALPRDELIEWIESCWVEEEGAYSPFPKHVPNMHSTLSAIQVLAIHDALDVLNRDKIVAYVQRLQSSNGSFSGDKYGETDSRFSYIAISILSLLHRLDAIDIPKTVGFIQQCANFDGGFGMVPGAESHAAYTWTCVGALAILDRLDLVDAETVCWWLCERQLPNGGLNGRPEKLEDVCYSFWALASLEILGKRHWIDNEKLTEFILSAQDEQDGGIADRPEDWPDVWHTVFGLAGLSMMGYPGLEAVDPVYCMPRSVTSKLLGN